MEQDELLRAVTRVLEDLDLAYLVTGSMATIYYGEPRFTVDIDIVVDLPPQRPFSPLLLIKSIESLRELTRLRSMLDSALPVSSCEVRCCKLSLGSDIESYLPCVWIH